MNAMTSYGTYRAFDILYDTGGHMVDPSAEAELITWLGTEEGKQTTDLILISHGWNNDISDARLLYSNFFASMASVQQSQNIGRDRKFAVVAVFWPSKRFADSDLIPGGAAAIAPPVAVQLNSQLDQLKLILAADPSSAEKIEHAREQIPKLEVSQSAQDDFVFALVNALPAARGDRDEGLDDSMASLRSGGVAGHLILARLSAPVLPAFPVANNGSGHALGLGGILSGITSAASRLANLFTYYTMKDRAGLVGTTGVLLTLQKIKAAADPGMRLHLIGHSFGGRLVTAAANALPASFAVDSMMLLEAAYSHNGMSKNWDGAGEDGSFRSIIDSRKVKGSILITHSVHDIPVGLAYPIASRIMNQVASAVIGGPTDKFGGMGRNGARHTPEAFDDFLLPVGESYTPLAAGLSIRNLNGDGPSPKPTINGHSDVAKPEIAWAWLTN